MQPVSVLSHSAKPVQHLRSSSQFNKSANFACRSPCNIPSSILDQSPLDGVVSFDMAARVSQKLLAMFAAVAVFVTCFHCPCEATQQVQADSCRQSSGASCCCHCEKTDQREPASDGSGQSCPTCSRCKGSAISESSTPHNPAQSVQPSVLCFDFDRFLSATLAPVLTQRVSGGLSPPVGFSTLLSQHCALNF
jgi:hypothetical protein